MRRHAVAGRIGRDTASAGSRSAPAGLARPCPGRRPAARRKGIQRTTGGRQPAPAARWYWLRPDRRP